MVTQIDRHDRAKVLNELKATLDRMPEQTRRRMLEHIKSVVAELIQRQPAEILAATGS